MPFGKLVKTATGIAKKATGQISNFRQVLGANPSSLSLLLPPQVSMGIKVANQLGLKIPSTDVLIGKAMSELDKAVFGAYRPNTDDVLKALRGDPQSLTPNMQRILGELEKSGLLKDIQKAGDTAENILNKIDWLL